MTVPTNSSTEALSLPLRVTLAWTDPPGNPAAAIKLVNNLILMVSNNVTGDVYFGNDIPTSSIYNETWNTNYAPNLDTINNVENVFLPSSVARHYTVTVIGYSVNVNAVTAQTNNTVQDYALVIACGEGEVTNAITVTANPFVSNPTGDQDITVVGINANGMSTNTDSNGGVFLNQLAGASTPLLGTNHGGRNHQLFRHRRGHAGHDEPVAFLCSPEQHDVLQRGLRHLPAGHALNAAHGSVCGRDAESDDAGSGR